MTPFSLRRLALSGAALAVLAVFVAPCVAPAEIDAGPSPTLGGEVCADLREAVGTVASWAERAEVSCEADDVGLMGLPKLPPVLQQITDHVHPVFSTDSSHDIPNAAAAHDAELDREAAEGMPLLPRRTGPTEARARAAADVDESIAAARARLRPAADKVDTVDETR
jgi:hypothetical protein